MSGTEEAEWILVWIFPPFLGFLQQQGTQKIFLNKAWNWLFAFCLWNFLWLTNWTLIPALPGKADALAELGGAFGCSHQKGAQIHLLKALLIKKKKSPFSGSCWWLVRPVAWQMPLRLTLSSPPHVLFAKEGWHSSGEVAQWESSWHFHRELKETAGVRCPTAHDCTEWDGSRQNMYALISKRFPKHCRKQGWKGNQDVIPRPKGTSELSLLSSICLICTQNLPRWGFHTLPGLSFLEFNYPCC